MAEGVGVERCFNHCRSMGGTPKTICQKVASQACKTIRGTIHESHHDREQVRLSQAHIGIHGISPLGLYLVA